MAALARWSDAAAAGALDPFRQLAAIAEEFDRAFADLGFPADAAGARSLVDTGIAPDLRVAAEGDGFHVAMDVPGLSSEGLRVECLDDTITVAGEWPEPAVGDGATLWRAERPRGRFVRTLALGEPIDPGSVEARLADGVLHVTLRRPPQAKGRAIPVKS